MKTLLSILMLSAAVAGPAAAQDIRISLVDKNPTTIRADIYKAAEAVCYAAQKDGELRPQEVAGCVFDAADDGLAQARAYAARSPRQTASAAALASNGLAEAGASK